MLSGSLQSNRRRSSSKPGETVQSHPPASGSEHASTSARDSFRKWHIERGLYKWFKFRVEDLVRAEELTSAVKRLIQAEEGIMPALQLVDAADIDDGLAQQLKGLIEKRRIRFLLQAKADGADVDLSGLAYEAVIASLEDLTDELEDAGTRELANRVAAMGGSLKGVRALKAGAGMAKINNQEVEAPDGDDLGFSLVHDPVENSIRPAWLSKGEFIMSVPAVKALGLRSGAAPNEAHAAGIKALRVMHEELRGVALNSPLHDAGARRQGDVVEENDAATVEPAQPIEHAEPVMTPAELLAEAQIAEERRERAAVADETGRWHASDGLIEAVIRAESSGNPKAISPTGAIGLMQVLPSTAADPGYGVEGLSGSREEVAQQLLDPLTNKRIGTAYLDAMLNRFGGDVELALAAYNQGAGKIGHVEGEERPLEKFAALYKEEAREALPYVEKVLAGV